MVALGIRLLISFFKGFIKIIGMCEHKFNLYKSGFNKNCKTTSEVEKHWVIFKQRFSFPIITLKNFITKNYIISNKWTIWSCGVLKISVNLTDNFNTFKKYWIVHSLFLLQRTHTELFFKKVSRKDTTNLAWFDRVA